MKTILVPTDFSDVSRNASEYALAYAKEFQYKVIFYHAYHFPITSGTEEPLLVMVDPLVLETEHLIRLKEEVAALMKNYKDIPSECIVSQGLAVDEVIELENKKRFDLIIMGIQSTGILSQMVVGSISTDIIRKGKTPVIIIPENATFKIINKVALGVDYRAPLDTKLLEPLKNIVKTCHSKLYILNVVKPNEHIDDKSIAGIQLENYFEDVLHTTYFEENDVITDGINDFVSEHNIDLIAVIPQKQNLLERIFKKSQTKDLAFHAQVPLITLC
ncbi:MAG: universal stress protein [Bacteroidia bacterium]